jgi:hypothetical protein
MRTNIIKKLIAFQCTDIFNISSRRHTLRCLITLTYTTLYHYIDIHYAVVILSLYVVTTEAVWIGTRFMELFNIFRDYSSQTTITTITQANTHTHARALVSSVTVLTSPRVTTSEGVQ